MDDRVDRAVIETLLTSSPNLDVSAYVELNAEHGNGDHADALILACSTFTPVVSEYARQERAVHPERLLLLVCTGGTNGHVTDAIESGVDEILTLPANAEPHVAQAMSAQLALTIEKGLARRHGSVATGAQKVGRMICVLGLKGGGGKTLTSTNLAAALAAAGKTVAIVDLDLQFGDVGLSLGVSPERTVFDLVRSGGSLDADKLADFLTPHSSGVRVLLAPARPDQAGVVTADFLRNIYPLLRSMHDFVIVDTPPSFTPEVIGAVDASTEACVVAMLDALSLKNSKLGLETLELMDYAGRVRVVLNRADSNVGIARDDVVSIIGRAPDVLVPSDRNITRSVNQGEPITLLSPRSDAARAYRALAAMYIADQAPAESPAGRRGRRLFRRAR